MNKLNLLSFSGAATKIPAHVANAEIIIKEEGFKPDIITGVSSGALVILPILLNKWDLLKKKTTELELSDIFATVPVNKNGKVKFTSYFRALFKGSLGAMIKKDKGLVKTIKSFISEKEYDEMMSKSETPLIYIGVTNVEKNEFELIKLNDFNYEDAVLWITASSTIPIYCDPIKIGNYYYYDGGLKVHNPAVELMNKYDLSHCISVYSRPSCVEFVPADSGYTGKSIGRNLSKTLNSLTDSISCNNEREEIILAKLKKIKLKQYFAPSVLLGVYDIDKTRLKKLYYSTYSKNTTK